MISYVFRPTELSGARGVDAGAGSIVLGDRRAVLAPGRSDVSPSPVPGAARDPRAVRHHAEPIYGSFIVFVIPGISLVLNYWPILLTSVVMFVALRIFIHDEDDALQEKLGKQYALRLSGVLYATFVLISVIPFVTGWFTSIYLVAFVPMDIALVYLASKLLRSHTIEEGRAIIRQLYLVITDFVGVVIVISIVSVPA